MEINNDKLKNLNIFNSDDLCNAFTQIYFLIEYINFSILKEFKECNYEISLLGIIRNFRKKYSNKTFSWKEFSEIEPVPFIIKACIDIGINPKIDSDLLNEVIENQLFKNRIDIYSKDLLEISKRENLEKKISEPYFLDDKYFIIKKDNLSSIHSENCGDYFKEYLSIELSYSTFTYLDDSFDFIDILQKCFIYRGLREEPSIHFIQRWVRKQFDLHFNIKTKLVFAKVIHRLNKLFFSVNTLSQNTSHSSRSSTVGLNLMLSEVTNIFKEQNLIEKENFNDDSLYCRQAIGFYLTLRLCKLLRNRNIWIHSDSSAKSIKDKTVKDSSYIDFLFRENKKQFQVLNLHIPLEYNHMQAKIFGAYSCIQGMNFIFRGGLLPYHHEGKASLVIGPPGSGKTTYALQRLVEIAFYGGLGVYLSFEEDYDIIIDRLCSFNLINYRQFRFVKVDGDNLDEQLSKTDDRGLLIFYVFKNSEKIYVKDIIEKIANAAERGNQRKWKWRAIAIDSINSLTFSEDDFIKDKTFVKYQRAYINDLIFSIKSNKYFGIILSEKNDPNFSMLPYLCDTVVEIGKNKYSRWIEVMKARNQNFHSGIHPLRISDGVGIIIYPSLGSILSSLRHKMKTTISHERIITLPDALKKATSFEGIYEKAFTLICGPPKCGKTLLMLEIITSRTKYTTGRRFPKSSDTEYGEKFINPESVLLITFRTPETRYTQNLRQLQLAYSQFLGIDNRIIRWFSPGMDLTAEQLVSEVSKLLRISRRNGTPIERIVFDEIESSYNLMPDLKTSSLFWPTLFQILRVEAITAFFIVENDTSMNSMRDELKIYMDYIIDVENYSNDNNIDKINTVKMSKWINLAK